MKYHLTRLFMYCGLLFALCNTAVTAQSCLLDVQILNVNCQTNGTFFADFRVSGTAGGGFFAPQNQFFPDPARDTVVSLSGLPLDQPLEFIDATNGCILTLSVGQNQCNGVIDSCDVNLPLNTNIGCSGGSIELIPDVFTTATLDFVWTTGETTPTITVNQPGRYCITATNPATGCQSLACTFVRFNDPIVRIREVGDPCDPALGYALQTDVTGGTPPYVYAWDNATTDATLQNPTPGTYELTVTDADGCSVINAYTVSPPIDSLALFPFVVQIPCGETTVDLTAGPNAADYDIVFTDRAGTTTTGPNLLGAVAGTYQVYATSLTGECDQQGVVFVRTSFDGDLSDAFPEDVSQFDSLQCTDGFLYRVGGLDPNAPVDVHWDQNGVRRSGSFVRFSDSGPFTLTIESDCDTVVLNGNTGPNPVCGVLDVDLYLSTDGSCGLNGQSFVVPNRVVEIVETTTGTSYFAITNSSGNLSINLPVGTYALNPVINPGEPFLPCSPGTTAQVTDTGTSFVNVFMAATSICPRLETNVSMPFLRRCFSNGLWVDYANEGSGAAAGAVLVVDLDPTFVNVTSTPPFTSSNGNSYVFDLGAIDPFETGRINFEFTIDCNAAEFGQTHCVESSITPNNVCDPPSDWSGAIVDVTDVVCDGDSVRFVITNVGSAAMTVPLEYIVLEDSTYQTAGFISVPGLAAGATFEVVLAANGSVYHLTANQEPDFPGGAIPSAIVERCGRNAFGGRTFGFANALPIVRATPGADRACRPNVGAYDPNDKRGFPLGHSGGQIEPNTRLDYAIRFQNTGTDTAFTVFILDTLDASLDISTFKPEGASHDYEVSIDSNRVIRFQFDNIMLPDSFVNAAASQGVVNFSIDHDPSLDRGDFIRNQAAIYFDFNPPIFTNVSTHQLAKDALPTSTRPAVVNDLPLSVYPNPSSGELRVQLPAEALNENARVLLTDAFGRTLRTTTLPIARSGWNYGELPAGFYVLVLTDDAGRVRGRTVVTIQ